MKSRYISLLILFYILSSCRIFAQTPVCICGPGETNGRFGYPDSTDVIDPETGDTIKIPVVVPRDPNEIIGPKGYDSTVKWVSVKDNLPYKILFENDPEFATAPAQKVIIYMPIHPKLNPNSLRIGDFGFGSFTFTVPPNTSIYTNRLDVRDSLGVFIDITAGLDVTNRRAFWVFQSIDPATGLSTSLPASAGFLPVNDSASGNGEGYVTFTIQPVANAQTRESISATADIIFDINDPLATNVETNIIDAVAPTSKVNNLPPFVDSVFTISWTAKDDTLGVGVKESALYYSKNNGPYLLYRENIDSTAISFTGDAGATYKFHILATDFTGNKEAPKTIADQTVTVKGNGVPLYVKAFLHGAYQPTDNLMTDSLRKKALLPTTEPYRTLGYTPANSSPSETSRTGLFDSTGSTAITDWIWLELRNATLPAQIVATRSALIRRDGSVVDMDGISPVYFNNVAEGNYYVALRHRNHLGVMTAGTISLSKTSPTSIDFTSPLTATYGTNAMRNLNGVMTLWGGDANGDGMIRYNGTNNDKNIILGNVGLTTPNNILAGYMRGDINLDGIIRYNGAFNDKNVVLGSVGLTTPNNVVTAQLP